MSMDLESGTDQRLFEPSVQAPLSAGWHDEVVDRAALGADQVVMVANEFLGQLVARQIVAASDLLHDSDGFEIDHISVHGTLRKCGALVDQLENRGRAAILVQKHDQLASSLGVHLLGVSQALASKVVYCLCLCLCFCFDFRCGAHGYGC